MRGRGHFTLRRNGLQRSEKTVVFDIIYKVRSVSDAGRKVEDAGPSRDSSVTDYDRQLPVSQA